MNIKEISSKILVEGGVRADHYTDSERILDINNEYFFFIEKMTQKESRVSPTNGNTIYQIFSIASDIDTSIDREIIDTEVIRLEYRQSTSDDWRCIDRDIARCESCFSNVDSRFDADEKKINLFSPMVGEYRVTYPRPAIVPFDVTDLVLPTPPSPTFLPLVFHPLLYLRPALTQAQLFKPSNVKSIETRIERLETLFNNHYDRSFETIQQRFVILSREDNDLCKYTEEIPL